MNKKISIGVAVSLIAIACTVTFVVTWTVSFNMYNDIIPGAIQRDEISSKLHEIDSFVQNNFLGEIIEDDVAFGIFSGYISGIDDTNTVSVYMTVEEHTRHANEESGQLVTCGVMIEKEESGYIVVTGVYPGSSAESFGVMRGDIITDIDSINVLDAGADTAMRFLPGEENTRVSLVVLREGEPIEFSLIRQAIEIVSVESSIINNIGLARITTFNELTAPQFETALNKFEEAGVRALLFDLRANSSDIYNSVPDMVNRLTGADTIAFTEHRNDVRRDFIVTDDSRRFEDIPIIILADAGTSGAGELMAAILKTHSDALIVGRTTVGNPFLQQTQPLKDGSAVRLTVARIVLANGFDYEKTGISPDHDVEMEVEIDYDIDSLRANVDDPQIRKAFEIIETITVHEFEEFEEE
jgi:carboxyl-terminal processing protease